MYLTAHRPVGPPGDILGINAYLYRHGTQWSGFPPDELPDLDFVRGHENAPRAPNDPRRLRSYLDLLGPDDASVPEMRRAVAHLHGVITSVHGPRWSHLCGRCRIEFALEGALANVWHAELHWLWGEAERVWLDPRYSNVAA
jgi:hypothetical protein